MSVSNGYTLNRVRFNTRIFRIVVLLPRSGGRGPCRGELQQLKINAVAPARRAALLGAGRRPPAVPVGDLLQAVPVAQVGEAQQQASAGAEMAAGPGDEALVALVAGVEEGAVEVGGVGDVRGYVDE